MTQFLQKSGFVALLLSGFIAACGSVETVSDKDISKEALLGTKEDGSDSKVFGQYFVSFSESLQKIESRVDFKLKGSTGNGIMISEPNKIELNGEVLNLNDTSKSSFKLEPSSYSLVKSSKLPENEYVFKWFQDSKIFVNSFVFPKSVSSKIESGFLIPNNTEFKFAFVGADLIQNEKIEVSISSKEEYKAGSDSIMTQSITAGHDIMFTAAQISRFRKGKAEVLVSRFAQRAVQQGHGAGGNLIGVYKGTPIAVNFAP